MAIITISNLVALILALGFLFTTALAFSSILPQDFCVADLTSAGIFSGQCKDPSNVTVADFSFSGVDIPGNLSDIGGGVRLTFVDFRKIPGLYRQDLIFGRVDYAPNALTAPHFHHKGAELITILEGTLEVGFITSFPSFTLYRKVLNKGDVFIIPHGVVHYQRNVGKGPVVTYFFSGSENNRVVIAPDALFGAKPEIDTDYLARAFQLDTNIIRHLQAKF